MTLWLWPRPRIDRASGDLQLLARIPLGIKDCRIKERYDCGQPHPHCLPTSTVTANLRKAGIGMLGKLNMDEFAMGSSIETSTAR
jgi:aspartyl-tRNA(Asn)/glutamyl-tRNA(Gln) amidotransferase subunit A